MIDAVDHIADVVQIARNLRQLGGTLRISERQQNIARLPRHLADMREAVLCEAKHPQRVVGLAYVCFDLLVFKDLLKSNHQVVSISFICFLFIVSLPLVKNNRPPLSL